MKTDYQKCSLDTRTQVPQDESRGRLGGAPCGGRCTSAAGKRQSCTTSRLRLTAHPRLPGRSRTLSLICVVKEILLLRRETAVTARGRRNGLAIKGLSAEAVQLFSCFCAQGGKAAMPWLPSISKSIHCHPAMAISTLPPCTQNLLQYGFNRFGHGGRGGNAMASFYFQIYSLSFQQWRFQPHPPCPERPSILQLISINHITREVKPCLQTQLPTR